MITAIVYSSLTGHTRQYADLLSAATGLPAYALGEEPLSQDAQVIYLSWLSAGRIVDLSKARKKYRVVCVCASGMSPASETLNAKLRRSNAIGDGTPLFYLQGGLDLEALPAQFRPVMRLICRHTEKQLSARQVLTPSEAETLKMARGRSSAVSESNIVPVVRWFRSTQQPE